MSKATSKVMAAVVAALVAVPTVAMPAQGSGDAQESGAAREASGWELADEIRERVEPPTFPDFEVDITDFGADPTGEQMSTDAFRQAVEAVTDAGGGRVVVPSGEFVTGAIHLQSNVELHVTADATIKFSQDPADYLPVVYTRWEGVELLNYSAFIYAYQVENVAITGSGTLDGQADSDHWWTWGREIQLPDRAELFRLAEEGVPAEDRVFGGGHFLRPNFVQFYESKNILVEGVTLTNSPMWTIHPVLSENVTVDGVTLNTPIGLSTDGVNPESSRDVVIKNSHFNNNDDNIAIKSGRDFDGRRIGVPSENIVIENNLFEVGHGAVSIGSEMSGSVRNVFAENNVIDSPDARVALRLKTSADRGGVVEEVYFRDNDIRQIGLEVFRIDFHWERGNAGDYPPIVRNFYLDNIQSNGGNYALHLRGFERSPISNIYISNSSFDNVGTPTVLENLQGLRMENVTINGESYDTGHVCDGRVWVGDTLSTVADREVEEGICVSDRIAGHGNWNTPEQFVAHVIQVTAQLRAGGVISDDERDELMAAAEPDVTTPVRLQLDEIEAIDVGDTAEVTARFANQAMGATAPIRDLRLQLRAPDGWTAEARTPEGFRTVRPGQTVTTTWAATRTSSDLGAFSLAAEATYIDPETGERAQASSPVQLITDPITIGPDDVTVIQPEKLAAPTVAEQGAIPYVDRDFVITRLPSPLAGSVLIPGANDDKQLAEPEDYLVFDLQQDSTVYVAFDERGEDSWWPAWFQDSGFERTDMVVRTTDPGDPPLVVFEADMPAGQVTLGPNSATSSSSSSYLTFVAAYGKQQTQE